MGRNRILMITALLLVTLALIMSVPSIKDQLIGAINKGLSVKSTPKGNLLKDRKSDKGECGTCHSEEKMHFDKKYKHTPFAKWYCTDCHTKHTKGSEKTRLVVDIDKLCTSCHFENKLGDAMASEHSPYKNGKCIDCHSPHSSDYPHLTILPADKLCSTCHNLTIKFPGSVKHKPFEKNNCLDCHDPHASKYKKLAKLPGKQLCFTCHFDKQDQLLMPVQHWPFANGDCTKCHNPHATDNQKLLILDKTKLCFSCHTEKEAESKTGYQHKPFVEGNCTDCHQPHGAKQPALLNYKKSELCFQCHSDMRDSFNKKSHHPVGNGSMECNSCHDPHSGPAPRMLIAKDNQLCLKCHIGLTEGFMKLKHSTVDGPAGKGLCINCHIPHSSDIKPLLRMEPNTLCKSCHNGVMVGYSHPVGNDYKDPWHGGYMKCISCHNPHGTENNFFLRKKDDRLCLTCHTDKSFDTH